MELATNWAKGAATVSSREVTEKKKGRGTSLSGESSEGEGEVGGGHGHGRAHERGEAEWRIQAEVREACATP